MASDRRNTSADPEAIQARVVDKVTKKLAGHADKQQKEAADWHVAGRHSRRRPTNSHTPRSSSPR